MTQVRCSSCEAVLTIPEGWQAWQCPCGRVMSKRVDPTTCLRFANEGRYCWPDDGDKCANCQQIIRNRAGDLADVIDQHAVDKIYGDVLRANGKRHV